MLHQHMIKVGNLKRLYSLIGSNRDISRAQLAQLTKLSKPTVSALVDQLIGCGLIIDGGVGQSDKTGRKPTPLAVNGDDNYVAVFSWHKTYILAALVNTAFAITHTEKVPIAVSDDYVQKSYAAFYDRLLPKVCGKRVLGICVVVPSIIDGQSGHVISTVLDIMRDDNPLQRLSASLPEYSIVALNDTASYAYTEYIWGCADTADQFMFVNIGRGVGSVLLNKGVMFRGANGMTTQFGHLSIDRNGVTCSCGNRGCMESMIGEAVLPRRAQECGVADLFEDSCSFEILGKLANSGDARALRLIAVLADDLAFGLGNMISVMNPQLIVIGGSGVALGETFLALLEERLPRMSYPLFTNDLVVRYSKFGKQSELQGAAKYFMDRHFGFFEEEESKIHIG